MSRPPPRPFFRPRPRSRSPQDERDERRPRGSVGIDWTGCADPPSTPSHVRPRTPSPTPDDYREYRKRQEQAQRRQLQASQQRILKAMDVEHNWHREQLAKAQSNELDELLSIMKRDDAEFVLQQIELNEMFEENPPPKEVVKEDMKKRNTIHL